MKWNPPKDEHLIYEALSAIADGRIELIDDNTAKCTSTSRGKYYTISYEEPNLIMSNDNMAFYREEVSYPMVAMLLELGKFKYDTGILTSLKGIKWKDINQKNKNDYMKSVREVLKGLKSQSVDTDLIKAEVKKIFHWIIRLGLNKLGSKVKPPQAY